METRNLIKFGKNSYVVTLPSSWVKQNKLEKGDNVFVSVSPNGLVISPAGETRNEEKKTIISIDGKDDSNVFREIVSAYVNNSKIIEVQGEELNNRSEFICDSLHALMSLEILEQTSDKIVVRDFLKADDISIDEIIKRIDNIIKVMLEDCIHSFEDDFSKSLREREKSINRFYFLLYRLVKGGFVNRSLEFEGEKLLNYYIVTDSLENLGDDCKKIASWISILKINDEKKKVVISLLSKLDELYRNSMKAYHNNDKILGHKSASDLGDFINEVLVYSQTVNNKNVIHLLYEIRNFFSHLRPIVRLTLQK